MNSIKRYLLLVLIITSFSFAQNNNTNINFTSDEKEFIKNNPIINVGAETDWPPFDFVDNGKYTGFAKDYLDLIQIKSGLRFNYVVDTWTNLLEKTKNKEIDLLPSLAKTENREEFLLFTEAYVTTRDYLFARETDNSISSENDIQGKTAAIIKGYVQEETFKKEHPKVKLFYAKNILDAMDAVITKKADFIILNNALMNYYKNLNSISSLEAKFHSGYKWNRLHMAVRDDYDILKSIVQKSIDAITVEEKNPIIKKWIEGKSLKEIKDNDLNLSELELEYIKNKKSITIANELGWIPYDYFEENTSKGYVIDYVKLLSTKLGLETTFVTDKWSILLDKFKKGEIDVLPVISHSKNREEFINFTKPYLTQTLSIVTKTSKKDIINIDDLKDKRIGMIKGWNSTNIFKKSYPNINVIEFNSLKDVFDAIRDNFVDATIQNKILASFYINKDYYDELKIVSDTKVEGFKGTLHMGIGKKLPILHSLLEKAINSVTREELSTLNDKWINTSSEIKFTEKEQSFIDKNIVRVGTATSWAPITFKNEKNKLDGIALEFWKNIVDKSNLKVEYKADDKFFKILDDLKQKEIDVILGTTETRERKDFGIFSDSYLKSPIGVATLQDKNYISNASELIGKRIAVGKNFTAHKLLEEKYPEMEFVLVDNVKEGLVLVSNNNVYAYVDIMPVLTYNIKTLAFTNLKVSGQTGIDFKLKMMIRNDYPILKSIINKVLNRMEHEEKEKIYSSWINTKIEGSTNYSLLFKVIGVFLLILVFVLYKNRQLNIFQDKLVSAKKESDKALDNFKTLIDLNIAGILIIRDYKVIYLNTETKKILGYSSKKNILNKKVSELFETNQVSSLYKVIDNSLAIEINAKKSDGEYIPVLLKSKVVEFDNLPSRIISIVDLTEIKNKEELMIQQSKMASLGEMIGNIAHQWRQPLSSISTAASGIKLQKEFDQLTDEDFNKSLDNITETTQFLSQTIDDFQNYIKDNKSKHEFDILNSIEKVLSIMKGSFVNNFIIIEKDLSSILIDSYENELNQALLNILSNAKDALSDVDEDQRFINVNAYKKDDNAIIEILDSGGGIKIDILNKVFEPYFTTKHKSQGTGLGLYMTHKIITESIGGEISIKNCSFSNHKHCTKVILTIPIKK